MQKKIIRMQKLLNYKSLLLLFPHAILAFSTTRPLPYQLRCCGELHSGEGKNIVFMVVNYDLEQITSPNVS